MSKLILELAKSLITIQSTKDNPKELERALNLTKKYLEGFNFREYENNGIKSLLFYNTKEFNPNFNIILNAHLDVIPANPDQYEPKIKNNRLIGRGAYDMKAAAAAIIILYRNLAKKVTYPLALQIVTDEEVGGFHGTKYQIEQGIRGEFIIAGENTDLMVNNESKGIIWLKIKTHGKSSHGAYPWDGQNAIWHMKRNLDVLEKLYPVPTEEVWKTTVNLAHIKNDNSAFNKVPDNCEAWLDIRYIPQDAKKIIKKIQKKFELNTTISKVAEEPAHYTNPSNPYIVKLLTVIEKETKNKGKLVQKHGGSDVRFFSPYGCSGITFGPVGFGHHSDYEWVDIKSLEDYYLILKKFLLEV